VSFFVGQLRKWASKILSIRPGTTFIVIEVRKFTYDENKNVVWIYDENGEIDIFSEDTLKEHTEELEK
jgi:hypothetical protein